MVYRSQTQLGLVAPIPPLAWELPYAAGMALKKKNYEFMGRGRNININRSFRRSWSQPSLGDSKGFKSSVGKVISVGVEVVRELESEVESETVSCCHLMIKLE